MGRFHRHRRGAAAGQHHQVRAVRRRLVISIPIVVWGSTLILRWLERLPGLLYVGGAVLAWTSANMIAGEPFVHAWLAGHGRWADALYVLVIGGTLGLAWLRNRRALTAKEIPS